MPQPDIKRKPPCIGGTELVSLSCNRVLISAESDSDRELFFKKIFKKNLEAIFHSIMKKKSKILYFHVIFNISKRKFEKSSLSLVGIGERLQNDINIISVALFLAKIFSL